MEATQDRGAAADQRSSLIPNMLTEVYPGEKGDGENHELIGLK